MPPTGGVGFLGRERERERLDAILARARDGDSAVLVVRGEAGIGKTALLRYAARQASGLRVAEVEGIQAEMELSFAGAQPVDPRERQFHSGLRVAEVEGIQAEMELSFAGIHRLCAPMLAGLDVLPEPQQNALRVAWGMASGNVPDRFLVAVAVLNLLSASAEKRPLL